MSTGLKLLILQDKSILWKGNITHFSFFDFKLKKWAFCISIGQLKLNKWGSVWSNAAITKKLNITYFGLSCELFSFLPDPFCRHQKHLKTKHYLALLIQKFYTFKSHKVLKQRGHFKLQTLKFVRSSEWILFWQRCLKHLKH